MLVLFLASLSLLSLLTAVWILWPRPLPAHEEEAPEPLLASFRGLSALALNTFPRQHDRGCSRCNGRALVWSKDERRHDAWVGSCRRCGAVRLDVAAGVALER